MFIREIVAIYFKEERLVNGKPNALKVKPTILMDTGYFDFPFTTYSFHVYIAQFSTCISKLFLTLLKLLLQLIP